MNKTLRQRFKKIYKERRIADGKEVGRHIHNLKQTLEKFQKDKVDPNDPEVQTTFKELMAIRQAGRFRDDFPSFAKFKAFIEKEGVTLKEATEA